MDFTRFATALRQCGRKQAFKHGQSLHSQLIRNGSLNNVYIANNLISMYVDLSYLNYALQLFEEMPHRDVITWTTMVSAYANSGSPDISLRLYTHMLDTKSETPNGFLHSVGLKACSLLRDVEMGKFIHSGISREELESDTVLFNTLLDMYVKCGSLSDAKKVFDVIVGKNSTSWNTLISGYSKEGYMEEALALFHRMPEPNVISWNSLIAGFANKQSQCAIEFVGIMHREGLKLDGFTLPCALKTCGSLGLLDPGKELHCYAIKLGFERSFTACALVDMYSNCNGLDEAITLFDQYSSCNAFIHDNLALWNSMLSGYVINERYSAAMSLVSKIHSSGSCMDCYTYSSTLKACINLPSLKLGLQVHGLVVTSGYELDFVVGSILVDIYARLGNVKDGLSLFWRLPEKDIVAWSSLISGCTKVGLNSFALLLFKEMVKLNSEVGQFVISSVLKSCSSLVGLRSGEQVHGFCVKNGYVSDSVTVTSLIDMYSKCGEIESGLALFDYISERDTVCWTGIIVGCGQNGRANEAIKFFEQMVKFGLKPNEITFLGVLSACRHAGLVEEARTIFKSMNTEIGLEPQLEHYYCMVDLLGLAGCFIEAMKLIADMSFKPDQRIWVSLLGACGTHKNTELVDFIAGRLLEFSPKDPSIYATVANVYAILGLWDASDLVRKAIKRVGMKEAGRSWIEITN